MSAQLSVGDDFFDLEAGPYPCVFQSVYRFAGNMNHGEQETVTATEKLRRENNENVASFIAEAGFLPEFVHMMSTASTDHLPYELAVDTITSSRRESVDRNDLSTLYTGTQADMQFTDQEEAVLASYPGDCMDLIGAGLLDQDRVYQFKIHVGWKSLAAGFLEEGLSYLSDEKGVDVNESKLWITNGAQNIPYRSDLHPNELANGLGRGLSERPWGYLFQEVKEVDGEYYFVIRPRSYIIAALKGMGFSDDRLFIDTTDTLDPNCGYASHIKQSRGSPMDTSVRDLRLSCVISE